jgi:hypothetical protein
MSLEKKYLKYKNKYISLIGGLPTQMEQREKIINLIMTINSNLSRPTPTIDTDLANNLMRQLISQLPSEPITTTITSQRPHQTMVIHPLPMQAAAEDMSHNEYGMRMNVKLMEPLDNQVVNLYKDVKKNHLHRFEMYNLDENPECNTPVKSGIEGENSVEYKLCLYIKYPNYLFLQITKKSI